MTEAVRHDVPTPPVPAPGAADGWRRFGRHFGEMVVAMIVGMAVLGSAIDLVLGLITGEGVGAGSVELVTAVMTFNMTVPMVAWMHFKHRMPVGRSIEMAASMIIPSIAAVAAWRYGLISAHAVMAVQHVAMIPSMLAVMLWRRSAYSH